MNVFEFAMKMEEDGKGYYQLLASQTSLPGLQTIFTRLAEDEQKHYEVFRKLKNQESVTEMQDSTVLEDAKNIFESLPKGTIPRSGLKDSAAGYDHAMELEAESFKFYERAADQESNPQTRELLLKIALEERKHFNIIENIFSFVNAPNQSLEWAEFSNLNEFRQFGRDTDI